MEKISLSKNAYLVIFLEKLLLLIISIIVLFIILYFPSKISFLNKYKTIINYISYLSITSVITISLYCLCYPFIVSNKTFITIYEDYLEYNEGFIFNKKTYIPIRNLMQIETTTTFIASKLNTTCLVFGTSFLSIKTKPFDKVVAKKIVYYIIQQQGRKHEN